MEVLRILLDHGGHVEPTGPRLRVPLVGAASKGKCEVVKLLLERGASIGAVDPVLGRTALSQVLRESPTGYMEFDTYVAAIVERLLDNGAIPTWEDVWERKARLPAPLKWRLRKLAMRERWRSLTSGSVNHKGKE
ncbi:hypothetical protein HDU93_005783, partial [Gonapodya sp. JEL0774]